MQAREDDAVALTKIKVKDILAAAMNQEKATRMKLSYKRSLGISWAAIEIENSAKMSSSLRNQELMEKYLAKMKLSSFLHSYENKMHSFDFINKLIGKYKDKESLLDHPLLRVKVRSVSQVWKVLTRTDKNMKLYSKYYLGLVKSFDSAFKDFANIIDLDVRRTKLASENPVIYKKMTNILFSYAK